MPWSPPMIRNKKKKKKVISDLYTISNLEQSIEMKVDNRIKLGAGN